jgi:hypothetical protein
MALTKSFAQVDEWQAVTASTVVEGAVVDVSACYQAVLTIFAAHCTAAAVANGMDIRIQISSNSADDEDWFDFCNFIGPTGTSATVHVEDNPLDAGDATILINPTTGFAIPSAATDNGLRFIKDSTIANSEVVMQKTVTTSTNITIVDGVKNAHAQNTPLWSIVGAYVCQLPDSAIRARIIYNNCKDATAEIDVMARIMRITAI